MAELDIEVLDDDEMKEFLNKYPKSVLLIFR